MKKMFLALVSLIMVLAMASTLFVAMADNTPVDVDKMSKTVSVEFYSDKNGLIFANENGEKGKVLPAEKLAETISVNKIGGVSNGLIYEEAKFDLVPAVITVNGPQVRYELVSKSSYTFKKVELLKDFAKVDKVTREYILAYGDFWARPLIDTTLEINGNSVGHVAEKYDKKVHILVARYWFGAKSNEYLGVYLNSQTGELVLCLRGEFAATAAPTKAPTEKPTKAPRPTQTPKPTERPTEKPTDKPTEKPTDKPTEKPTDKPTEKPTDKPTEKPTDKPTEKPTKAPKPTKTPKPTEKPTEKPTDKPTEKPTDKPTKAPKPTEAPTQEPTQRPSPRPIATPIVTAPPDRPGDNDDGGYGENPLNKLTPQPVATPVVTAKPDQPADNDDGGYGQNPLQNLQVNPIQPGNNVTTNPPSGGGNPQATPKVNTDGDVPLG